MKKAIKRFSIALGFAIGVFVAMPMECKAEEIKMGQSVSGELGSNKTVEYDFTVPTSGCVSFSYTYTDFGNNRFIIKDASGEELLYMHVGEGTFSNSLHMLAGDYKLVVRQYHGLDAVMKYSVVSSFKPSNETVSESYFTLNNDVASATPYKLNSTVKGQIAVNDDKDIYKVSVKKNGFVDFTVLSELKDIQLHIVNDMGDITYDEKGIAMGKRTYSYFLPKGTYYVTFSSVEKGNYSFKAVNKELKPTSLKKVVNTKKTSTKVTWKRQAKVDGYVIQYSTSNNFKKGKKTVTIDKGTQSSVKITNLKKNKKYYVRICSYKVAMNEKTYYSSWSKAKSITIKK